MENEECHFDVMIKSNILCLPLACVAWQFKQSECSDKTATAFSVCSGCLNCPATQASLLFYLLIKLDYGSVKTDENYVKIVALLKSYCFAKKL